MILIHSSMEWNYCISIYNFSEGIVEGTRLPGTCFGKKLKINETRKASLKLVVQKLNPTFEIFNIILFSTRFETSRMIYQVLLTRKLLIFVTRRI